MNDAREFVRRRHERQQAALQRTRDRFPGLAALYRRPAQPSKAAIDNLSHHNFPTNRFANLTPQAVLNVPMIQPPQQTIAAHLLATANTHAADVATFPPAAPPPPPPPAQTIHMFQAIIATIPGPTTVQQMQANRLRQMGWDAQAAAKYQNSQAYKDYQDKVTKIRNAMTPESVFGFKVRGSRVQKSTKKTRRAVKVKVVEDKREDRQVTESEQATGYDSIQRRQEVQGGWVEDEEE